VRGQDDRQRLHRVDRPVGCGRLAQHVRVQIVRDPLRHRPRNEGRVGQTDLVQPVGTALQKGQGLGQLRRAAREVAPLEFDLGGHKIEPSPQNATPQIPRSHGLTGFPQQRHRRRIAEGGAILGGQ